MSENLFKITASLIIFGLNVFSSFLPFCFNSQSWVSYAESLAGGVFLGAFAVHLFPEAIHSFGEHSHSPIGPIISLIFFAILLTVDLFASSHGHDHDHDHCCSNDGAHKNSQSTISAINEEVPIDQDPNSRNYSNDDSKTLIKSNESRFAVEEEIQNLEEFRTTNLSTAKNKYAIKSTTLVVYFVLVFHCIIEAFGFGLLKSHSLLIALFCAIIGHKPVETFSMGILLLQSMSKGGQSKKVNDVSVNAGISKKEDKLIEKHKSGFSSIMKNNKIVMRKYCLMMVMFSAVTPLTILFSMYFGNRINSSLHFGFIAAASAGVFMFVGFHELAELLEESGKWNVKSKIFHILWFVVGLSWMAIIGLFSEEHEH